MSSWECKPHRTWIQFEGPENVAAILMEGGSSGCIKYPRIIFKKFAHCDKYGILLIADEVMSGFGRTGTWFGVDVHGVVPDMIATAKGITAGLSSIGSTHRL